MENACHETVRVLLDEDDFNQSQLTRSGDADTELGIFGLISLRDPFFALLLALVLGEIIHLAFFMRMLCRVAA